MAHKSGFLSGPEPEEIEEKTTAELKDKLRPSAMSVSSSMYDLAETDDRPAIEQKAAKGVLFENGTKTEQATAKDSNSPKNFQIDANFAAEMKERDKKERAERAKRQQAAEKAEKQSAAERKQKIAEELQNTQSLDEEDIKDRIKEEIADNNENKLYPDAESFTKEVEDEIWKKRTEAGAQIATRAKIEDVENTELANTIKISLIFQIIGAILFIIGLLISNERAFSLLFCLIGFIVAIATAVSLIKTANKNKQHKIPSNHRRQFVIATYIPGFLLRLVLIEIFSKIPITGALIGPITGAAIGASIHYTILNRYFITVSIKETLVNTAFYAIYCALILSTGAADSSILAGMPIITCIFNSIQFLFGDRAAVQLALYTNK